MIEIINYNNDEKWDKTVKSFNDWDVYYLNGYVYPFFLHGDGEPVLIYYESNELRGICVLMMRDIKIDNGNTENYFDMITPYGYGGFIFEGEKTEKNIETFYNEYQSKLKELGVISVFYRFHPQLNNAHYLDNQIEVIDLGKTIEMFLDSEESIMSNMHSKNRNTVRKAIKNNVLIKHGLTHDLLESFMDIYNSTMDRDEADSYYYFDNSFYNALEEKMNDNLEVFYAEHDNNIIAMSLILYGNGRLHYHLSGSNMEGRRLSATNLLLYEVAKWGSQNGYKTFHLGGGVGSKEDGLFSFKKVFNKESDLRFSIGKQIVDQEKYDQLVKYRKEKDTKFDDNSGFFPLYRS